MYFVEYISLRKVNTCVYSKEIQKGTPINYDFRDHLNYPVPVLIHTCKATFTPDRRTIPDQYLSTFFVWSGMIGQNIPALIDEPTILDELLLYPCCNWDASVLKSHPFLPTSSSRFTNPHSVRRNPNSKQCRMMFLTFKGAQALTTIYQFNAMTYFVILGEKCQSKMT